MFSLFLVPNLQADRPAVQRETNKNREPTDTSVNVDESPESIPLDLIQPLWGGKRLTETAKGHRLELREGH